MNFVYKLVISVALISITTSSLAGTKTIPCPPMELIKKQANNVSYVAVIAPENYAVGISPHYTYMKNTWSLVTLLIAQNKKEAMLKGKENIFTTYQQYNLIATHNRDQFECRYLGMHGSIFSYTSGEVS